jgi:ATP-binding cassette subfamily A (ABC1) protein 3
MGFWIQYKALMFKNWVLWKRKLFGSLCELILPIFVILVLGFLRLAIPPEEMDKQTFKDQVKDSYKVGPDQVYGNSVPFSKCIYNGGKESLGYSIIADDEDFISYMIQGIDTLTYSVIGSDKFKRFESVGDFEDYITSSDYEDEMKMCFGVVMKKNGNEYKLEFRYNITETIIRDGAGRIGSFMDIFDLDFVPAYYDMIVSPRPYLQNYYDFGFLSLMNLADNYLLSQKQSGGSIKASFYPMRFDDYIEDTFLGGLGAALVFFLIFSFLIPVTRMLSGIVQDKETRTKEIMMMMGLKESAYWLSWITYYLIIYTFICVIITILSVAMGIYTYSNGGLIFLYYWLFGISCIAFSVFLSVFFSKSRNAVLVGIPIFLGSYFVGFAVGDPLMSMNKKAGASLLPCVNFGLGTDILVNLELGQKGMQVDNSNRIINNYSHGIYFAMIIIDIVYLSVLAAYLEAVWPSEWGVKRPWYFLVQKSFWCPRKTQLKEVNETKIDNVDDEAIEDVDPSLESQKSAGKAMIVRNLSKKFGNKVAVENLNLDIYEGQIFGLLGHNGAGKTTTISMLTGLIPPSSGEMSVNGKSLSKNLEKIREILGVCPQQNILFPDLTPLEHMYLFCKFKGINDSDKIEELSMQKLSELELTHKKDIQSKNLSGGQKRKLQLALALIGDSPIVLLDEPTSGMDLTARRHMWDMLKNNKNGRIIILTTHYMEEADVLADRIAIMSQGKLKTCGSSLFLKSRYGVGYYLTMVRNQDNVKNSPQIEKFVTENVDEAKMVSDYHGEITFQLPTSSSAQFNKFFERLDSLKDSFGIISYSMSATTLEEVFLKVAQGEESLKLKVTKKEKEKEKENGVEESGGNNFVLARDKQKGSLFFKHFWALLKKRAKSTMRDRKTLIFEIFIPVLLIVLGLALMMIPSFFKTYSAYELKLSRYSETQKFYSGGEADGFSLISQIPDIEARSSNINDLEEFSDLIFDKRDLAPKLVASSYFAVANPDEFEYDFTIFNDQKAIHSYPTSYGSISRQILKQAYGSSFNIKYYNHPLPITKEMDNFAGSGDGFVGSLIFSLGFSFIPTGIVLFITKERETSVKHQHMISGVSLFAYWSSNFVWDAVKHLIPAVLSSLIILAFQVDIYTDDKNDYGAMWVLILLGGISQAPFSYMLSFFFKSHSTAQIFVLIFSFITGSLMPTALYVMHIFESSRDAGKVLAWVFKIFPNFCFGWGVINVGSKENFAAFFERTDPYNSFDVNSAGGCMLLMGIMTVVYFAVVVLLELFETNPAFSQCLMGKQQPIDEVYEHDDDVDKEAEIALNTQPATVQVNVKNLCKSFKVQGKLFTAVNKVCFNVNPAECFALLGVNGAGKTTTFKMLTGEIFSDVGIASIGGFNVAKDLANARTLIGYCPQFDAISDLLTAKEHLELYAHIKGIPNDKVQEQAEYMLKNMDLTQYRDILAGTYSGGNKRKLSVAMALIGNPSVVFLDEPSAGMDPEARKKMWKILGRIKKQKSAVILTTHSMEEAEALCDRMTIMVRGRLKCIGTTVWIKNKFGDGYELEVKAESPAQHEVNRVCDLFKTVPNSHLGINFDTLSQALHLANYSYLVNYIQRIGPGAGIFNIIQAEGYVSCEALASWCLIESFGKHIEKWLYSEFNNVEVIEHFSLMYKFKIKRQTVKSIGYLFSVIEANKNELFISDYAISMTSLEQIFNRFAKKAELEEVERMNKN